MVDCPPRLASLHDVVQLLHVDGLSVDDVLDLARRWRAEPVVARAVTQAWAALEPKSAPPLVEWARNYVPAMFDRLLLASDRGPARRLTPQSCGGLVVPPLGANLPC